MKKIIIFGLAGAVIVGLVLFLTCKKDEEECVDMEYHFRDADGDSFFVAEDGTICAIGELPVGYALTGADDDCDDSDANINTAAVEVAEDDIDQNCNGMADDKPGLVAWYKFDEGEGATTADSSGNGNTGTITDPLWVSGYNGNAIQFGDIGNDRKVTVSHSSSIDLTGPFTLVAWVYINIAEITHRLIIDKFSGICGICGYQFWIENTNIRVVMDNASVGTSAANISNNEWIHLAVVWDGTDAIFYKNGVHNETVEYNIPINNVEVDLEIGLHSGMIIDDVRIYNKVKSAEEICFISGLESCE